MQDATQQQTQEQQTQQQKTVQLPDKTERAMRPEARRRRPPVRVICDCCGPAEDEG